MKRTPVLLAAVALVASGLGHDAIAATKKKPAPPKPVTMNWFLHGATANGNSDMLQGDTAYLPMDATAPSGASVKEVLLFGAIASPNSECTAGPLLPSWTGTASGTLQGKVTVSFYARSTPGNAIVRVFNVNDGGCNDAYTPPVAEATVALPTSPTASLVTVTLPVSRAAKLAGALTLQIIEGQTSGFEGPQVSGVSYDSTTTPSKITFTCLPKIGKKTC
ncbi:MAG TPA: hypothetical protein VM097_02045 [Mycobacteriales bacterium]|nr:hypothetical protein [Mycobacteriales bacterium]